MTIVLVVDDDPAIQRTLAIGLRARGYHVLPARDGRIEKTARLDTWTFCGRRRTESAGTEQDLPLMPKSGLFGF